MYNLTKNIDMLCRTIEGAVKADGSINTTKAADEIGLGQTTLMRILKNESEQARPLNEKKIADYFKITVKQLYSDNLDLSKRKSRVDLILDDINELTDQERLELISKVPGGRIVFD